MSNGVTGLEARIRAEVDRTREEVTETRRVLHRHPELSLLEHDTAELVARRSADLGFTVRTGIGGTGVLADLASYHSMLGDRDQALSYLDRSLALGQNDKELLLNAAVVYNQLHETGPALEWLGKALAAGYSRSVVATGAPFDNLHDNPQYQALMRNK